VRFSLVFLGSRFLRLPQQIVARSDFTRAPKVWFSLVFLGFPRFSLVLVFCGFPHTQSRAPISRELQKCGFPWFSLVFLGFPWFSFSAASPTDSRALRFHASSKKVWFSLVFLGFPRFSLVLVFCGFPNTQSRAPISRKLQKCGFPWFSLVFLGFPWFSFSAASPTLSRALRFHASSKSVVFLGFPWFSSVFLGSRFLRLPQQTD
jgi:hypothetical protein